MSNPLISVIIPAYNAEQFLASSIESVLSQSYTPLEVIVIDDGSTDATADVAKAFAKRITFLSQPNRGHAAARNYALSEAKGEFIAFNDADDLWADNERLKIQAAALDADPSLDAVFGHSATFRNSEWPHPGPPPDGILHNPQPAPIASTMLIRRKAFDRVGPFNESTRLGVFLDWYIRAREKGLKELMLPQVLIMRRVHADNASVRETAERNSYAKVLKAALDRRRAAEGKTSG